MDFRAYLESEIEKRFAFKGKLAEKIKYKASKVKATEADVEEIKNKIHSDVNDEIKVHLGHGAVIIDLTETEFDAKAYNITFNDLVDEVRRAVDLHNKYPIFYKKGNDYIPLNGEAQDHKIDTQA